jgi:hypothetical protein
MHPLSEIYEWYRFKENRRNLCRETRYGMQGGVHHITLRNQKESVRKSVSVMGDSQMRDSTFKWMNDQSRDRRIGRLDKARSLRKIKAFRAMRLSFGLPRAFWVSEAPFWSDPHSKYVSDHNYENIAQEIDFTEIRTRMTRGRFYRIFRTESFSNHHSYWFARVIDDDDEVARDHKTHEYVCLFAFTHPSDMVAFRLRYEFEIV